MEILSSNDTEENESTTAEEMTADQIRKLANQHFAAHDFDTALPLYEYAVDLARKEMKAAFAKDAPEDEWAVGGGVDVEDKEPPLVIHLCNKSACLYKMEMYEEAMGDAKEAVEVSGGKNIKAYFRLARTQIALHLYTDAISNLETALEQVVQQQQEQDEDPKEATTTEEESKSTKEILSLQKQELHKLLELSKRKKEAYDKLPPSQKNTQPTVITSIKLEPRKPSIREFNIQQTKQLGAGNFSRIIVTTHKTTQETFALKIIEKKKCESLAKRQHPNVYNEVKMERRVLTERITPKEGTGHCRVVRCYHAFQDYTCLYFLMDLYVECGDLWSTMRYKDKMVGTHPSLIKVYISEILDAVEHLHSHGIVHRDLKPENVILNDRGHIIVVDFGTAKDLVYTDLNGPEFVGTADFMSPEAVKGTSGEEEVENQKSNNILGADHTTDLWALGAVLYHLHVGTTPFVSPSPYLTFLKIQRGNLYRPLAIADDDAWDLMTKLLKVNPKERLGADCFEVVANDDDDGGSGDDEHLKPNKIVKHRNGYDVIRNHPYFSGRKKKSENDDKNEMECDGDKKKENVVDVTNEPVPIPSLRDLCIRSCAELVRQDSLNLDIENDHPPGDGSCHDMLRLNKPDQRCVMHVLDRLRILSEPRVYRRFFKKRQEWRLNRIRPESRDFVGLTQMLDRQGNLPSEDDEEGNQLLVLPEPVKIVHLMNPLLVRELNEGCTDEAQRKEWIKELKDCIRAINRMRPKAVWVSGFVDPSCRKLIAKVNESIPVIMNDGSEFFSAWVNGAQGLFIQSSNFMDRKEEPSCSSDYQGVDQLSWIRQELEQSRMSRHHTFVFADCDPMTLPTHLIKRFARGRTLCVFGPSSKPTFKIDNIYDGEGNVKVSTDTENDDNACSEEGGDDDDDDYSVDSTDSDKGKVSHSMSIVGGKDSGLYCITLADQAKWTWEEVSL
uniref:Protein kinase domain-containing protein n=2 Tax=Ditylum brightwellii TaxID=49249 RepID=A0A7S4V1H4_9STRA